MITKCACQHCGNPIEFEAEHNGALAPCPHCGQETILELPAKKPVAIQPNPPEPKLQPVPPMQPKTVPVFEPPSWKVEYSLDNVGYNFFAAAVFFCAIGAIGMIFWDVESDFDKTGTTFLSLVALAAIIGQAYVVKILLNGFAEIIRLLRRNDAQPK